MGALATIIRSNLSVKACAVSHNFYEFYSQYSGRRIFIIDRRIGTGMQRWSAPQSARMLPSQSVMLSGLMEQHFNDQMTR
jgi:predicted phosphoribosyltransferase